MPLLTSPGYAILPGRVVRFALHQPDAHTVRLAGDFTGWSNAPLEMRFGRNTDSWEVETPPLSEGVHFYKYIVDGRWTHDPAHPLVVNDDRGGWNSVLGIGGPSLGDGTSLRVASLNLHTYQEPDPLLKLEQIAFALAAMDVDAAALQEVGEHTSDAGRPNAGEIIRTHLQALTGQPWVHAWRMAHPSFVYYREGVSLLARVPLADLCEYRLNADPPSRNTLAATLDVKGHRLRLVSVHASWLSAGGLKEVQELLDRMRAEPQDSYSAVLLAGDFNSLPDHPQTRAVLAADYLDVAATCPGGKPFPTAAPQHWQQTEAPTKHTDPRAPFPASRLDYHFFRPTSAAKSHQGGPQPLKPLACVPIFNGLTAGDVYQPVVSDHIGILGVYAAGL